MKITEIKDQELSTLIANYLMCDNCKIVDRDQNRITVGYKCPNCKKDGEGGRMFFSYRFAGLVDTIQEFYHYKSNSINNNNENTHHLSVLIFFSTIGEVLFDEFLQELMMEMQIIPNLIEKLLFDNQSMYKKKDLFKTLTNSDIKKDLKFLHNNSDYDYNKILDFYIEVRNTRNKILHRGYSWFGPENMPEDCINNLPGLLDLFVALHNKYIAYID